MTQERDDYMKAQEAHHDMIAMRHDAPAPQLRHAFETMEIVKWLRWMQGDLNNSGFGRAADEIERLGEGWRGANVKALKAELKLEAEIERLREALGTICILAPDVCDLSNAKRVASKALKPKTGK